ncbi:MAG: hypothetical protein EOS81_03085 [Mesorhizobium sp.]|uniref:hypothetical protein n=1 Tax=Mesorhizobium sp. TaxID=1871066 RepID=UPI000FE9E30B|nr:MAG: hypothetical protein EOS81_03085 [Mesorhizobium sp.]
MNARSQLREFRHGYDGIETKGRRIVIELILVARRTPRAVSETLRLFEPNHGCPIGAVGLCIVSNQMATASEFESMQRPRAKEACATAPLDDAGVRREGMAQADRRRPARMLPAAAALIAGVMLD